jgi:ribose transport system permease protein
MSTPPAPATSPGAPLSRLRWLPGAGTDLSTARLLRTLPVVSPYLALLALVILYASVQDNVLTIDTLNVQSTATVTLALVAAGQTIVILTGGIDLSLAGIVSVTTSLFATRNIGGGTGELVMWLAICILLGATAGAINGLIIGGLRVEPFIATLATWSMLGGVALIILPSDGGTVPQQYITAVNQDFLGIVIPFWILVAIALFGIWFRRSRIGISIRALGSERNAAFLSGTRLLRTTIAAYALAGAFAAMAGLFLVTQTATGSPLAGDPYLLTSVAAVVIGGTFMGGGRGGLGGTIVAAVILTLISSVVFALGLSSFWPPLITGLLLILSVLGSSLAEIRARRATA